jgi:hypothetical protein
MNFKDLLEVTVGSSDADNTCQCPKRGGQ